jgi:hypothetical protein
VFFVLSPLLWSFLAAVIPRSSRPSMLAMRVTLSVIRIFRRMCPMVTVLIVKQLRRVKTARIDAMTASSASVSNQRMAVPH